MRITRGWCVRCKGRPESEVTRDVEAAGRAVCVVERDGEYLPIERDGDGRRVNLRVAHGIVVEAYLG